MAAGRVGAAGKGDAIYLEMMGFTTSNHGPARSRLWTLASVALVVLFAAIATAVSAIAPAFEAPDEVSHFGYVRSLVVERRLPPLNADSPAAHEAGQAPLYYLVGAGATFWLPGWHRGPQLLPTWQDHNPYASFEPGFREPPDLDNRNLYGHSADEGFPFRGDVLVLHLLRLVSVAFGTLALVATMLTARELFPTRPSLAFAAGALMGLNPQFIFMSAVVNNDSAAAGCASLTLYLLIRAVRRGVPVRDRLFLGAALGLSLLAKISLVGLLPVVGLGLVATARPLDRDVAACLRHLFASSVAIAATALVVAGWWYVRNWLWYGDPLAWEAMLIAQQQMTRPDPIPIAEAAVALFHARDTYWAAFGWTNVLADPILYIIADVLILVALAGLLATIVRSILRLRWSTADHQGVGAETLPGHTVPMLAVLGVWILIVLVALVRWVQTNTAAAQGRLLFPAAGAVALLLSVGLLMPLPRRAGTVLAGLLAPAMLVYGWVAFSGALVPAYRAPETVASPDREAIQPLMVSCACGIEIVGYRYRDVPETPDGEIAVDVFWRVTRRVSPPQTRNWSMYVGLFDPRGVERARLVTWPGGGRLPTAEVPIGVTYREQVRFRLPPSRAAPGAGQIRLAFFYGESGTARQAEFVTRDGQSIGTIAPLGRFRWPSPSIVSGPTNRIDADYEGGPTLVGLDVPPFAKRGGLLPVRLYWRAGRPIVHDYTVSVQLLDDQGQLVGQSDSEPRQGRYPMSLWNIGELVADTHRIVVDQKAPSIVRVQVIVYSLETGERLSVASAPPSSGSSRALEVARVQVDG